MKITKSPKYKTEIKQSLNAVFDDLEYYLQQQSNTAFQKPYNSKWSSAEHLGHLILSAFPVASALKQEKSIFTIYGTAENGSRNFDELYEAYKQRLAAGQQADAKRIPTESDISSKEQMLATLKSIFSKIDDRMENWSEENLDQYRVPHPALGLITFRELLFFTSFHTRHHLEILKSRDRIMT